MQLKRIADDVVVEAARVADLVAAAEGAIPEPFAAHFASGALVRDANTVRVVDPGTGATIRSAGLGDHVAILDGAPVALGERDVLRYFDPV